MSTCNTNSSTPLLKEEKKENAKKKEKTKSVSKAKKQGTTRRPKKKELKKKSPSIWQQLSHLKSASNEQLAKFYTAIITGDVKDFTGLEASIDTKLKAAKLLLEINEQKKEEQLRQESNKPGSQQQDTNSSILELLKNRTTNFEKEVFEDDE